MNRLSRNGTFLLIAGLAAAGLAKNGGFQGAFFSAAGAAAAGLALTLFSFFPGEPAGDKPDSNGAFPLPVPGFPEPAAPARVLVPGALAAALGVLLFFFAAPDTYFLYRLAYAFLVGGFSFMAGGYLAYASPARQRNFARAAIAMAGFLLILAGIFGGVLLAAGAIDSPGPAHAAGCLAALAAGMAAAYYGLRYQQSAEGLDIGKALGFAEADGQVDGDGIYDAKGVVNGVETLIDVEQTPGGRHSRASFTVTVLCRCRNHKGLELSLRAGTEPDSGTAGILAGLQFSGDGVFNEEYGFRSLTLKGSELVADFGREGYADADYAKELVESTAALAARFT